jgi:Domain of unknown function (DUF6457)
MNRDEWITAFAAELGVEPPTHEQSEQLLQLASIAAHSSERPAAPLACWVAAMAGADADRFLAATERLSAVD